MSNERLLTIPYPEDLLLALNENEDAFAQEARLLLAVKLYEMGRISTGMAARLSGMRRVDFMFALGRFGLSPIAVEDDEIDEDMRHA